MAAKKAAEAAVAPSGSLVVPAVKKITVPGVYELSSEDYHADQLTPEWSYSSSTGKILIEEPPAAVLDRKLHPENYPSSKPQTLGTAAHAWLLEGDKWRDRFEVLPEGHKGTTTEGKARIAEIELAKKTPLKHADFETIKAMHAALQAHKFAAAAFQEGRRESSLFWIDQASGGWCRIKPDFLPSRGRIFSDYKTARSVTTEALKRAIGEYRYDMQSCHYEDGLHALGLCEDPIMLLVFQATSPPYLIRCLTIDAPSRMIAEEDVGRARRIFANCVRTNSWPDYSGEDWDNGIGEIGLPPWKMSQAEARAEGDARRAAIDYAAPNNGDE